MKVVDLTGKEKTEDEASTRKTSSASSRKSSAQKRSIPSENDLKARLRGCFERIADAAEARGDEELAEILRDDMDVMANGLMSFTRPFKALRAPLVLILAIVEPIIAFARLGRLVIERVMYRRAEKRTGQDQTGE